MDEKLPTTPCPECGQIMRLVGVERDDTTDNEAHLLTFECPDGHFTAVRFPPVN
jgi:predicted RNA-binding Zn-ribbon protein involved in translation (DUF1610 family)